MTEADDYFWYQVIAFDEIPARGARVVRIGEQAIALFRTSADAVFALLDCCPHRGGPLSQGIVHGNCVTCPLHDWVIELDTGEARAPDEGQTERFPVRIEAGMVFLGLDQALDVASGSTAARPKPLALAR
jgi:nitrite reductase (NADH) small subunit